MDRRALIALLTGVVVALLFAAIATAGKVQFADRDPSFPWHPTLDSPVTTIEPGPPVTTEPVEYDPVQVPRVVEVLLRALVYGGVAVVAFLFLSNVWRHRPRRQWRRMRRRRRRSVQFDVLDDVAAVLNADADAQRAALQRGSPRNAIVECWLRLEAAVVAAGVARDPADTSTELTVRVLATYHVDPVAIERLAASTEKPASRTIRWAKMRAALRSRRSMTSTTGFAPIAPRWLRQHEIVEASRRCNRRDHDRR